MEKESSNDILFQDAAKTILEADFFMLATGAGFSKDSGLAVYKDIADVKAWRDRDLTYPDLCQPHWIESDPDLFYGFWGKCFNDYRTTKPHEGYQIVKNWKEKYFSNTEKADEFKKTWKERFTEKDANTPGPFFIYTSNVDNHSITAGFEERELHEIHGNTEIWQCSIPCNKKTWSAPLEHGFNINEETMLALNQKLEKKQEKKSNSEEEKKGNSEEEEKGKSSKYEGFDSNHPRCIHCNSLSRPAILMFGDWKWVRDDAQGTQSYRWQHMISKYGNDKGYKTVILEIGCGINVPSVRMNSEKMLSSNPDTTTLIRINPDFPSVGKRGSSKSKNSISIKETGLKSIKEIDKWIKILSEK